MKEAFTDKKSVNAFFAERRGEMKMKGILIAVFILSATVLYGCIRVGAREDRLMEELNQKGKGDADGKQR